MADLAADRRDSFLRWLKAMGLNANRLYKETGLPKMTVSDYVTGKTMSLRGEAEAQIAAHYGYSVDAVFGSNDPDARETSFVTAWRERAEMTIEQLATATGSTVEITTLVEEGKLPLTGKRRIAFADALGVSPGFLLIDPGLVENSAIVEASLVKPSGAEQAAGVIRALRTGTAG